MNRDPAQPSYEVARITAAQLDPAWLLVSRVEPALGLEQWRSRCGALLAVGEPEPGAEAVLVATNGRGHVKGLCVAAARGDLLYGRLLDVPLFEVASAADEDGIASALIAALRRLARSASCAAIRVWKPDRESWSQHFQEHELRRFDLGALLLLEPG